MELQCGNANKRVGRSPVQNDTRHFTQYRQRVSSQNEAKNKK